MAKASFNGVTINYRCMGAGKDVVLIHGLAANQGFWGPGLLLPLARAYRVTLFDLRGHGYSTMPPEGYTSADMARDVRLLLDHLEIDRADLVGHSFGGVVALQTAALFPERVRSITLADSRIRAFQPEQSPQDWVAGEKIITGLKQLGLVIPQDEKEPGIWLLEQLASPRWKDIKEKLNDTELFVPFRGWNGGNRSAESWLRLIRSTTARQDFTAQAGLTVKRLAAIHQPTLIACCEISLTRESVNGLQKTLPHCQTVVIPGAGHFFPLTHPKLFLDKLTRFLETGAGERRRYERMSLSFPVRLRAAGSAILPTMTANVSRNGLLLESARKVEAGQDVEIFAELKAEKSPLALQGRVIRIDGRKAQDRYRFGVELSAAAAGQFAWQDFILQQNLMES